MKSPKFQTLYRFFLCVLKYSINVHLIEYKILINKYQSRNVNAWKNHFHLTNLFYLIKYLNLQVLSILTNIKISSNNRFMSRTFMQWFSWNKSTQKSLLKILNSIDFNAWSICKRMNQFLNLILNTLQKSITKNDFLFFDTYFPFNALYISILIYNDSIFNFS